MRRPLRALCAALTVAGWLAWAWWLWPRQRPAQDPLRAEQEDFLRLFEGLHPAIFGRSGKSDAMAAIRAKIELWNELHPDRPVVFLVDEMSSLAAEPLRSWAENTRSRFHFKIPES